VFHSAKERGLKIIPVLNKVKLIPLFTLLRGLMYFYFYVEFRLICPVLGQKRLLHKYSLRLD